MRHLSSTPTREELINTKIRIRSPEHSKAFQEACFNVGFRWGSTGLNIIYDIEYLFVDGTGIITYGPSCDYYFNHHPNEKVTFSPSTLDAQTPHIHRDLIIAWANGAEIEFYEYSGWKPCNKTPIWNPHDQYRIKPTSPSPLQLLETEVCELANKLVEVTNKINKLKENK